MPDHLETVIRGGILVTSAGRRPADVGVRQGRIGALAPPGGLADQADDIVDARGLHVLPGLIDGHVHFRQPGLEHKEDWLTGSRAAVMGGVTTVLEMPNTDPPTASAELAEAKARQAEASSYCDFGLFGLLGADNSRGLERLLAVPPVVALKAFLGPTTGGLRAPSDEVLLAGLSVARSVGTRVAFHAEDASVIEPAEASLRAAGRADPLAHLEARPVEAEVAAIERVGRLLAQAGARGHILHLSSAEGLAAVERVRSQGVNLTCEVSAHHCFLSADDYYRLGSLVKCNPPVREANQGVALLAGLATGQIDCIASDHAPHAPDEKRAPDIWRAAAGIAGVETTLSLFLTAALAGEGPSLEQLVSAFAERPAQAWGLWPRKGSLEIGADADLTLVDLVRHAEIRGAQLHGKHSLTPFEGRPTLGAVIGTIVRGRVVTWEGELRAEPGWGAPVARVATRPA